MSMKLQAVSFGYNPKRMMNTDETTKRPSAAPIAAVAAGVGTAGAVIGLAKKGKLNVETVKKVLDSARAVLSTAIHGAVSLASKIGQGVKTVFGKTVETAGKIKDSNFFSNLKGRVTGGIETVRNFFESKVNKEKFADKAVEVGDDAAEYFKNLAK